MCAASCLSECKPRTILDRELWRRIAARHASRCPLRRGRSRNWTPALLSAITQWTGALVYVYFEDKSAVVPIVASAPLLLLRTSAILYGGCL
jgi:serine/threonine protein kinase HipA of HipAB toxin-antitoxin module